jgi:hypothetical protein
VKSANAENTSIAIDEDEPDYSPNKQFLQKNLEESSYLPQIIPQKQEKKKDIIKKVRFHDD